MIVEGYTWKCEKKSEHWLLSTFSSCDPHVKRVLFSSHCLSLYGGVLWDIGCTQLKALEIAFNNIILRCIWRLLRNCHTQIGLLHKVACIDSVFNRLISLSDRFSKKICESKSYLLHDIFTLFYASVFTSIGQNHYSVHKHQKMYYCVRYLCLSKSTVGDLDIEQMIHTICCD